MFIRSPSDSTRDHRPKLDKLGSFQDIRLRRAKDLAPTLGLRQAVNNDHIRSAKNRLTPSRKSYSRPKLCRSLTVFPIAHHHGFCPQ